MSFSFEKPGEQEVLVSSLRLDGCISRLCNLSRSESLQMFAAGRVFVNGRLTETTADLLPWEMWSTSEASANLFCGRKIHNEKGKLCLRFETFT